MSRNMLVGAILVLACTFLAMSVLAEPPQYLNYQGRLTDDAGDPITNISPGILMTFTIWNDASLSDPGNVEWSAANVFVPVENGLFEYPLGPLPTNLFRDISDLWLGIKVAGDDELVPRTKLISAAYACHSGTVDDIYLDEAGDIMTGDLFLDGEGNGQYDGIIDISPDFANIELYSNENLTTKVWGESYGEINLYSVVNSYNKASLIGSYNGGLLQLYNNTGTSRIILDGSVVGDNSVILTDDAINADEILNEPGISSNFGSSSVTLNTSMQDLRTISIDIPSGGYIHVQGSCFAEFGGVTGGQYVYAQIDETSGGEATPGYYTVAGMETFPNNHYFAYPIFVNRVYYKAVPGTYTFRLEALRATANGTVICYYCHITAIYYPASYAAVKVIAEDPGDYPEATAISVVEPTTGNEKTMYEVDLRYYELRAKEARIKALEAEMELRRAEQEAARGNR